MKTPLLSTCVMMALPCGVISADWNKVVSAIGMIESSMSHEAIGDGGMSRGAWQLTEAAWKDVNQVRRIQKRKRVAWRSGVHNASIARSYTFDFLAIINKRLSDNLGRPPTVQELYAAYNLGLSGFKRFEFNIAQCPSVTRDAAKRVSDLCQ